MIQDLLVSSVPLVLASLGGLISDFSGYLAVFLEGTLSLGAFLVWLIGVQTGSLATGFIITIIITGLIGWLLSRFIALTGANPFIAALAVNVGSQGLTETLSVLFFNTKGVLRDPRFPSADGMLFFWIALILIGTASFIVYRTPFGLRLRASGRSPQVLLYRGIDPLRYRDIAWTLAAMLAAFAGGVLTIKIGAYAPGGTTGQGWIALVIVYLGFRRVWGVALAAIVFTFIQFLGIEAQAALAIPSTLLLGLPSLLALSLYILSQVLRKE
ncbi:ABC transporter permease [Gracilinema caldarium]|uniref:ABC transporter permease subunit n=1 Tax=Gracilinema caldarium TaxID=215591 RepID=UPI0026ECCB69|nr:ABC transporter permease [Gracilinema caldarium]